MVIQVIVSVIGEAIMITRMSRLRKKELNLGGKPTTPDKP